MFFLYNLQESQWQGWEENHEYCKTDCEKISYYNMGSDEATESTGNLVQSKFADETTSMKIKKLVQMQKVLEKNHR